MKFLRLFCIPQTVMILVVIVLGVSSMLSGCGQKGLLYLPKDVVEKQKQEQLEQQRKLKQQQK